MNATKQTERRVLIGVDTGGTFTDIALFDAATGRICTAKTASTPADPSLSFVAGIEEACQVAGAAPGAIARVLHGTTVATNLILEGKGAVAGLLTTAGFRYVLEIGRQDIPRRSNMFGWQKPQAAGAAGAHLRSRRQARARRRRKRAARRGGRHPCRARTQGGGRQRDRRCASCIPTRATPMKSAPPRFCAPSIPPRWFHCRAKSCPCSANTSAAWRRSSTSTSCPWSEPTWRGSRRGWRKRTSRRPCC